jgi:hypothetical protein
MLHPTVPRIMNALINVENEIEDHATVEKTWHNLAVEHLLSNTIESRSRFIQRPEFRSRFDLYTKCKACRQGHHYSCSSKDRTNIDKSIVNIGCFGIQQNRTGKHDV